MRKILGGVRRADERFSMISPGDKIAVGLSGGKDSMLLLYALTLYQKYAKTDYALLAVTVDLGFGNYATDVMQQYADGLGVPLTIIRTQISDIVFNIRKEKNPCALCATVSYTHLDVYKRQYKHQKSAYAHRVSNRAYCPPRWRAHLPRFLPRYNHPRFHR